MNESKVYTKKPTSPVGVSYHPPHGKRIKVRTGQSWVSLARDHCCPGGKQPPVRNMFRRGQALAYYNYLTTDPDELNWYLRHYYGSNYSDDNGNNFAFHNEANPGTIFIPKPKPRPKAGSETNGIWFGVGIQTSGRMLVGADVTYGVMYNSQSNGEGVPPTIRYVDLMDEGYTFSVGLGASAGLVLMFAWGTNTASDFESWGTTWTDFALSMGPNAKSFVKAIPALGKIPQIQGLAGLGSKLTHHEATYKKMEPLKTLVENAVKNRAITEPGLFMIPFPGASGGAEIGFGGRAHLTTVLESGIYKVHPDQASRSKTNDEIMRDIYAVRRPPY